MPHGIFLYHFIEFHPHIFVFQNYPIDDNRPDIFRMNDERQRFQPRPQETSPSSSSTTTSTTTTTTSTTTTTIDPPSSAAPQTLSPKEATDVNAILSKLISASGAASGGNGPRFVVVAPLPDNPEVLQGNKNSQSGISRADHTSATNERPKENIPHSEDNREHDLSFAASSQNVKLVVPAPIPKVTGANLTNRMSIANKEAHRRMSEKHSGMNAPNTHRVGFNSQPIELTGFEPFDSMMQSESMHANPSVQHIHHEPPHGYAMGSYKRGPPPSHFGSRNPALQSHHFDLKDQHIFNPRPDHNHHGFKSNHPQTLIPQGIGLKPIQQQLHHIESHAGPLQTAESNRWGNVGFPHGGSYVHKPPEGISIGISSPANNGAHVSSEPVSVIKSFFLPFLPKPRLNMNARVVFGVVLDKGMGIGASKKETHHIG